MNLQGDMKIDFRQVAYNGSALFHEACKSGSYEVVQLFLERRRELKIRLNIYGDFLIWSIKSKPVLELLLKDEKKTTNKFRPTALLEALEVLEDEVLNNRHRRNYRKITKENMKVIDTLLQSPRINLAARSSHPGRSGETALHLLARKCEPTGFFNPSKYNFLQRVEVFLKEAKRRNIDVINMQGSCGWTFVHQAFWVRNQWTMKKRYNFYLSCNLNV